MNIINDARDTQYAAMMVKRVVRTPAPPNHHAMYRRYATPERGAFSNEDHFSDPVVSQYDRHRPFRTTAYKGAKTYYYR